jgi:hypothetical protein
MISCLPLNSFTLRMYWLRWRAQAREKTGRYVEALQDIREVMRLQLPKQVRAARSPILRPPTLNIHAHLPYHFSPLSHLISHIIICILYPLGTERACIEISPETASFTTPGAGQSGARGGTPTRRPGAGADPGDGRGPCFAGRRSIPVHVTVTMMQETGCKRSGEHSLL